VIPPIAVLLIVYGAFCGWLGSQVAQNAHRKAEACIRNAEQLAALQALIRANTDPQEAPQ
jgi:hypothetical protein